MHIFYLLPLKRNRIVFISYDGQQCSCNPLYIYKYIDKYYSSRFDCFWIVNSADVLANGIDKFAFKGTLKSFYLFLTSGVIITNDRLSSMLPIRKSQFVINTWHGGGLFKNTFGLVKGKYNNKYVSWTNDLHAKSTKLFTSSSLKWTEIVVRERFKYVGSVCNSGMPRNDIFFVDDVTIKSKVKLYYNIPDEEGIILYAPTFRGDAKKGDISVLLSKPLCVNECVKACELMLGKKLSFMFRGHHITSFSLAKNVIDATNYPDMQELLLVADVLITDYSSCLWDYSLTYKPCFIYAPDIDDYNKNQGFESSFESWPFPIARNNFELVRLVVSFNQELYKADVEKYHLSLGSYESGCASKNIVDEVLNFIKR